MILSRESSKLRHLGFQGWGDWAIPIAAYSMARCTMVAEDFRTIEGNRYVLILCRTGWRVLKRGGSLVAGEP